MISADTTVIAVEASDSDLQPSFTYAEADDQQINDTITHTSVSKLSFEDNFLDKITTLPYKSRKCESIINSVKL